MITKYGVISEEHTPPDIEQELEDKEAVTGQAVKKAHVDRLSDHPVIRLTQAGIEASNANKPEVIKY